MVIADNVVGISYTDSLAQFNLHTILVMMTVG